MKPSSILALICVLFALQGLIPWIWMDGGFPILVLPLLLLAVMLRRRNRIAYRLFRGFLWLLFGVSLVLFILLLADQSHLDSIVRGVSYVTASISFQIFWLLVLSSLLYYTRTMRVKKEFGVA